MSEICVICDSPTANSFHFGAKACKACAAFFRRAVALDVKYVCKGTSPPCYVHCDKRMICKKCRYDKCLDHNMKPELVQSRAGDKVPTRPDSDEANEESPVPSTSAASVPSGPPSVTPSVDTVSASIAHYVKMQVSLNDRRKIKYTCSKIRDIFDSVCECPYELSDLVPFDYRSFRGTDKTDFIAVLDYAKCYPDFEKLGSYEKNILFRYSCATDFLMDTAYYTSRLGMTDRVLVMADCTYLSVDPLPMTGDEPDAEKFFASKEEFERYKSLIPPKVDHFFNLIIPFHNLRLSFKEYCLLKALVTWHISYYKFSLSGRLICEQQRNLLINGLVQLANENGCDPVERIGETILFISCVFEQVYNLVNSLVMITFFEIMDCGPIIRDLLDHGTY